MPPLVVFSNPPRSESATLAHVLSVFEDLPVERMGAVEARRFREQLGRLRDLKRQAEEGVHVNPGLGRLHRVGVLSKRVLEVKYRHAQERGRPYVHVFEHPTDAIVVEREHGGRRQVDVLLTSPTGNPLVEDI
jgi:hypothetical protein